jgi:uncharacterized oligopeptide transporter (OPT) family protein
MESDDLLRETYRLTLENNRLLHKMRRSAFWSRWISFIVYGALLVAPIWFYMQYLSPVVDQMYKTVQQVQGTGAQAQAQLTGLQQAWQQFESKLPGFNSSTTTL